MCSVLSRWLGRRGIRMVGLANRLDNTAFSQCIFQISSFRKTPKEHLCSCQPAPEETALFGIVHQYAIADYTAHSNVKLSFLNHVFPRVVSVARFNRRHAYSTTGTIRYLATAYSSIHIARGFNDSITVPIKITNWC